MPDANSATIVSAGVPVKLKETELNILFRYISWTLAPKEKYLFL